MFGSVHWLVTLATILALIIDCEPADDDHEYVISCYFTNWAQYGGYRTSNIDPTLCTHIIYSFAGFNDTGDIRTFEWNDLTLFGEVIALKKINPKLKVCLALGGWTFGTKPWIQVVKTQQSISDFAAKVTAYLRDCGFDGLDLDWEFPAQRGSLQEDKQRFSSLTKTLKESFEKEATSSGRPRLELTAAVGPSKWSVETSYEVSEITKYLDKIHLMVYDMQPENKAGHHSPFNYSMETTGKNNYIDIAAYWLSQGADASKLVFGLGSYGRRLKLKDSSQWQPGASLHSLANPITWSFVSYRQVCEIIAAGGLKYQLPKEQVPYVVSGDSWIGFDDSSSIARKAAWVKKNHYGGVMMWSLEQDDFDGTKCGEGKYPLLSAANRELIPVTITTSTTTTTTTTTTTAATTTTTTAPSTTTEKTPTEGSSIKDDTRNTKLVASSSTRTRLTTYSSLWTMMLLMAMVFYM